jgi:hypothetical protein
MTTTLKHFKFHKVPSGTLMLGGFAIAPTMQAIVVDGVTIVKPHFAAVIGDDPEAVIASFSDFQCACPTNSEVIASRKARPSTVRVAIVHSLDRASHIGPASLQVLASPPLSKVEDLLPETTVSANFGRPSAHSA